MILNGGENVFEQLANNYKKLIEAGVIKTGEYLPSCREVAKEFGVNPNTVLKAYTLLEEDGYVTKVLKKGVYVSYNENKNVIKAPPEFKEMVEKLKEEKIEKDELVSIINLVYGGEKND